MAVTGRTEAVKVAVLQRVVFLLVVMLPVL